MKKVADGSLWCASVLNATWRLLFWFFAGFLPVWCSQAQDTSSDPFKRADSELTAAYQQSLKRFSHKDQEVLRRAERAWIVYSDKEEAVLDALQKENLLTEDAVDKATINEVNIRSGYLNEFYVLGKPILNATKSVVEIQEQILQKEYDVCIGRLQESDVLLLREAERAWIAYRDAEQASVRFAYGTEGALNLAGLRLAGCHLVQLHSLVTSVGVRPVPMTPAPQIASRGLHLIFGRPQTGSPTPEDIKSAADVREEAKGVVNGFLAKKDDPFFKVGSAIKKAPSLPEDVADRISKLELKLAELSRRPNCADLFKSEPNESAAVTMLATWAQFIGELKTSEAERAGATLHFALSLKPKEVTPEYLPLWEAIQSWEEVYKKDLSKFQSHLTEANYLASSGKTSEAIKEYQAAYEILEIPSIPERINKVRQQSLGL